MTSRAASEYRYEKLTWPEINDAVDLGKVCILPCGAVEQHGPHLPLDVDIICPTEVARGAARVHPDKVLILPTVCYGYTGHVMDFPGTINNDFEHFMHHVLDITKSLAYHGFKKIVLLNGHGSNMPNLDLVARRTNLETDAECILAAWWQLLTVDKEFFPRWRQSKFPGGCAHACELETSMYLYLDGDNVRRDQIANGTISFNEENSPFNWVDLFAAGPATLVSWTSSYSSSGVLGEAELATAEKGREVYEEAVKQLARFIAYFKDRPRDVRATAIAGRRPCPCPGASGQLNSNKPTQRDIDPSDKSMQKIQQLQRVLNGGIVAIIRAPDGALLVDVAEALVAGGIDVLEVTFTVPQAHRVLEQMAAKLGDRVLLGAGTVLDTETARIALLAGAEFIVSPVVNTDVIELCRRYDKLVLPGALTPTEVLTAWQAGGDIIKVFPSDITGPAYLKALHGPLPQIRLLPTGGVNLETAAAFLKAGACALGLGSSLVESQAVAKGDFERIRSLAAQFVKIVRETRAAGA